VVRIHSPRPFLQSLSQIDFPSAFAGSEGFLGLSFFQGSHFQRFPSFFITFRASREAAARSPGCAFSTQLAYTRRVQSADDSRRDGPVSEGR
jgi:hypothetical protein